MSFKFDKNKLTSDIFFQTAIVKSTTTNVNNFQYNTQSNFYHSSSQTILLGGNFNQSELPTTNNGENSTNIAETNTSSTINTSNIDVIKSVFKLIGSIRLKYEFNENNSLNMAADTQKGFHFNLHREPENSKLQTHFQNFQAKKQLETSQFQNERQLETFQHQNDVLADSNQEISTDIVSIFKLLFPGSVAINQNLFILSKINFIVQSNSKYLLGTVTILLIYRSLILDNQKLNQNDSETFCNVIVPAGLSNSENKIKSDNFELYYYKPTLLIDSNFIENIFYGKKETISKRQLAANFFIARHRIINNIKNISQFLFFISLSPKIYFYFAFFLEKLLFLFKIIYIKKLYLKINFVYYPKIYMFIVNNKTFFALIFYVVKTFIFLKIINYFSNRFTNLITNTTLFLVKKIIKFLIFLKNLVIEKFNYKLQAN